MINILHLRDTDHVCGPGKTIIETACAADPREFTHKIGLFLRRTERTNLYVDAAVKRGVEVIPIRSAHRFDPRLLRILLAVIKTHQIHLLHSHEYKSDLLAWAVSRLHPLPIMSTVHGWIRNDTKRKLCIKAAQLALRRFQRVIGVSRETCAAIIASGVPKEKVELIHNGIVVENYEPRNFQPGFLRQRFNVPRDALIVGYVGRLSPEKGQADLLAAAARLCAKRRNVWFALIGDGPRRDALQRQARADGIADRVLFAGHQTDVRPTFRDLDIVALTSYTEGLPNVILEALCMGKPVIASDVGGVREIIADGKTGVLVPPRSPDRIALGLEKLMDDPAWGRQLVEAGRCAVHERFTFSARVAKEATVCRRILESW